MDRRKFLKIGAIGAGSVAASSLLPLKLDAKSEVSRTPLESEGYVKEPSRKIPVVDSADIVVVGGGPAGFSAAVAAARQGVDVLVLERQYFLGGLFTGCGVTPIINSYSPDPGGSKQAVRGICQELCDKLKDAGMLIFEGIQPKVDPEAAKYFMEEMFAQASVRFLYGVQVAQVVMSGNSIKSLILEGKSGRVAVNAKYVIDCSGDGDILEWAGEDFKVYKDNIGAMWRIGNAAERGRNYSPTAVKGVYTRHTVGEKEQDGLDMYNLTRIQARLRKYIWEDTLKIRQETGNNDIFLLDTPSVVGVRITRVLESRGNVSAYGAVTGQKYSDVVGIAGGDSTVTVGGVKYLRRNRLMWQVPYSSLVPKNTHNLLVAGRCFGFERPLTYDAREIGVCLLTGQAAGTAAALSCLGNVACADIDISDLQNSLRKQDVILDL